MKVLVTGSGRSGTGYLQTVLDRLAVPCGHESVFGVRGREPWGDLAADSSWLAVPWLATLRRSEVAVLHVVRDPVRVLRSFMGLGFFSTYQPSSSKGYFQDLVRGHAPGVMAQATELGRACAYWVAWNRAVEAAHGHLDVVRARIENRDELSKALASTLSSANLKRDHAQIAMAIEMTPLDTNTRGDNPEVRPEEILATRHGAELRTLAEAYGYESLGP